MKHKSKILICVLSFVTLVTARTISATGGGLKFRASPTTADSETLSRKEEIEKAFGGSVLGKTFYSINPRYSCILHEERMPSWEDSIQITEEGRLIKKGDRCSRAEIEIRELAMISVIGDGSAFAYGRNIYDRIDTIPEEDPGLIEHRFTESFCTLDHTSMPTMSLSLKRDLHFRVYNSSKAKSATYTVGTGDSPQEWKTADARPLLSRTITETVVLYQFNNEFSAYVSLPGAILNHACLFTAYDARNATGTGRGQCFLKTLQSPIEASKENSERVVTLSPES